jgi:hypothetical protein
VSAPSGISITITMPSLEIIVAGNPEIEAVAPNKLPEVAVKVTSVPAGPLLGIGLDITGGTHTVVTVPVKSKSLILNVPPAALAPHA